MVRKITIKSIPLKITLIYAALGLLWLMASNWLLVFVLGASSRVFDFETATDIFFILITSAILYLFLKHELDRIDKYEEALIESEEKFEMLVESTSSPIVIFREKILFANPAMEKLTGYSAQELLLKSFDELVHTEYRDEVKSHCDFFQSGGAPPMHCEFILITKGGEERWVDFRAANIPYRGKPVGIATGFDLTGLKRAQDALKESEERYRLLVESIRDYEIFMLDPEGRIISWNLGGELIKGYTAEEIMGRPHELFFTEEDRKAGVPAAELEEAARTGRSEKEGWRVRKDGSRFWANVITTAIYDVEGNPKGFSKVIKDVTQRKEAEDSLRESEERYRVIAQTASDAIITIDEKSMIVLANPAVEKLFGWKPEELVDKSLTMLMPERYRERHLRGIRHFIETGERHVRWTAIEVEGLRKDGTEAPLEISYGFFEKGGRLYFTGIARDMTERRQAEKEKEYKDMLERFSMELEILVAERTMSLMGLRLADRVRSPALVIDWNSRRILSKEELSEEGEREIAAVIEQAGKLEATVKEYEALLKSRRPAFSYEDLNQVTRDILPIIEREAIRKKVEIITDFSPVPVKINAQKDLLRMAIFTILRNAVESSPEGGRVRIKSYPEDDNVVLTISDMGPGIPADLREKIFDPAYGGLIYRFGVGLPIIKQIITEHLGKIEVESAPGTGNTFRMSFPVRWMEKAFRG
jgi:PAS domain S-box-containing protein